MFTGPADDGLHLLDRGGQGYCGSGLVEALARLVEVIAHPPGVADDCIGADQGSELGDNIGNREGH